MKIRGAPAIASLAALSLRSYLQSTAVPKFDSAQAVSEHVAPILDYLQSSRPTAVNLGEAMERIRATLKEGQSGSADELVQKLKDVCTAVHGEDMERCRTMGRLGAEWLWNKRGQGKKEGLKLVTVCNTGSLATSVCNLDTEIRAKLICQGYGTALGVITASFEADQLDRAYYAQTAPYHQGMYKSVKTVIDGRIPIDFAGAHNSSNPINNDL